MHIPTHAVGSVTAESVYIIASFPLYRSHGAEYALSLCCVQNLVW